MILPELPQQYLLPVSRTDWPALLTDWKPLLPDGATPWLFTKFGELFLNQRDSKVGMLQVSGFQYKVVAENTTDFREWLVDPDKMTEWFLAPLVEQLESSGKVLQPENCFSFIRPLGLGGALAAENVMTIPITEHFGCWGEVFQQIKDLPDGSEVILKVERQG